MPEEVQDVYRERILKIKRQSLESSMRETLSPCQERRAFFQIIIKTKITTMLSLQLKGISSLSEENGGRL